MKGTAKREMIFRVYSDNLDFVISRYKLKLGIDTEDGPQPLESKVYICPLCLRAFSIDCLDQSVSNPLTLEDIPPKSVGGNPKILTCKECNNRSGQSLDIKIQDSLVTESFLRKIPKSEIQSYISINDGEKYRALTQIEEDGTIKFNLLKKQNPKVQEDLTNLTQNWEGAKINFTFTGPNKEKLLSSLRRIGLLLTFYYFGNRVLFEAAYNRIRLSILKPELHVLPHEGFIYFPENVNVKPGIYIVTKPVEFRSYFVVFTIKIKTITKIVGFPFAGPNEDGWNCYCNYKSLSESICLTMENITSKELVTKESLVDAYDYLFNNIDKYWP